MVSCSATLGAIGILRFFALRLFAAALLFFLLPTLPVAEFLLLTEGDRVGPINQCLLLSFLFRFPSMAAFSLFSFANFSLRGLFLGLLPPALMVLTGALPFTLGLFSQDS